MSAIQVYKYDNGKYRFDLPAFNNIFNSSGDNLVAIYSMTGPLRLGKSFMLGFFLRYLQSKDKNDWISSELKNSFKYKGGSVRETTGIWIWSEPYIIEQNGRSISVFLMDTQGCFDKETSMQDNALVFALSTLLSSVMIFNIKKQLSEDILQFLQYFAGFARLANDDNYDEPFQRLMFLIRDWEFPDYPFGYYDDNTTIDGMNYKMTALEVRDDQPKEVKFVHESVMANFENISFYLMPHPGKEVAYKSNFDVTKVDEDFLCHLDKFVPIVLDDKNIIPKKIGVEYITGKKLIKFVKKWSQMFESDVIPEGKTIFEATAEIQNEMAKSAAIENYSRKMREQLKVSGGMETNDFDQFNSDLMNDCMALFKSFRRLGGTEYEVLYSDLIKEELNYLSENFCEMNFNKLIAKQKEQELENERTRFEGERQENERRLNALNEENIAERQRILHIMEENQNQMRVAEEKAEKERDENERRLNSLNAENVAERQRILNLMEENQNQMKMAQENAEKDREVNERHLNDLNTENKAERQRMLNLMEENQRQMRLVEDKAKEDGLQREQQMAEMHKQLVAALNKPPVIVEKGGGCTVQ